MDSVWNTISQLKSFYRSGKSNIGEEFFLPCLTHCSAYKRAVGFFSSSALVTWATILPRLVSGNKGLIQLLISPNLTEADKEALSKIDDPAKREEFIQAWADAIIMEAAKYAKAPTDSALRIKLFLWLVATGRLELRIAFSEHVDEPGIFHEKIGVFEFPTGHRVAFTGSANESIMGYIRNYESIDVYRSWIDADAERVDIKISQFEEAWTGQAFGLRTVHLSKETLARIGTLAPSKNPLGVKEGKTSISHVSSVSMNKWRHQDEAVAEFLRYERGVLEMATGTGKTRTALKICRRLVENDLVSTIVISTDGNDLLDQWFGELLRFLPQLTKNFAILRQYGQNHELDHFILNSKQRILLISRIALPAAIRNLSKEQGSKTILIHDEVHALGSPGNRESLGGLSDNIRFRLGLSATPEREYDEEGNKFIEHHIGPVIYRFEIRDAIQRGILAPFNYFALDYETDQEDQDRIRAIYAWANAKKREGRPVPKEEIWTRLAFVYKTSRAKLPVFDRFISNHPELLTRCIIFVETKEYGDAVLDIVHQHNYAFHTYYGEDDREILAKCADGRIQLLITCHRISEGIDIRSIETVILFSSGKSKLETIQRMGRCLRTDPNNPEKISSVVDFIRVGETIEGDDNTDQERKQWLTELSTLRPEGQ